MTKRRNKKRKAAQQDQVSRLRGSRLPPVPAGAVLADPSQQVPWGSYDGQPTYYIDIDFVCAECGAEETWTAEQQKWYYEVANGSLYGRAKYCLACRRWRRANLGSVASNWSRKGILKRVNTSLELELQQLGYARVPPHNSSLEFQRGESRITFSQEFVDGHGPPLWLVARHQDRDAKPDVIATLKLVHGWTRLADEKFDDWLKEVRKFLRNEDRRS